MKSHEFITETELRNVDWDGVISQIKRNCYQFLSESTVPMFRGMTVSMNKNIFSTVQTSASRPPRDTPAIINTYAVKWFNDVFKIPFRKEHTVFTTGSLKEATGYGKPFMVFPIGDFKYCWSPQYKDLTDEFLPMSGKHLSTQEIIDTVEDIMVGGNYQLNMGLEQAIKARREIMIYCKEYYIVDYDALVTDWRTRVDDLEGFMSQVFAVQG